MQFRLLGPLSIRVDGRECEVSAPRQRVVLAVLLVNANRVVSVDRIAAAVWDGTPPPSAAATVRTYVMRLRQALGERAGERIRTRAPGYLIELAEEETDLGRFAAHRSRAAAHARAGSLEQASAESAAALELWRGDPLVDIPSRTLRDVEGRYLQELRLQTLEARLDAELALRRHAEILPELWREVRESPLREALVSRLMLALFRSGRQSEALALFHRTRAALVDQLGAEPGLELREMQRRILAADDPLPVADPGQPGPAASTEGLAPARIEPARPRPAQLPARLPGLVARTAELAELERLLTEDAGPGAAPVVVTGGGGIGKSALALHAAHAVRDRFGHGQLFAHLGGQDDPVEPGQVLARFLTDLGVPAADLPADQDRAALLYRSLTADRRVLVVLDDASCAAQVRPLIPGSDGSRLVVTSRQRLADLDGAQVVALVPMAESTALDLLGSIIGHARVEAEPQAARSVVRRCSGLPLAVRIVGARYLGRPHWDLEQLARRLARSPHLLDELRIGDLGVRAALEAGYRALREVPPPRPGTPDPAGAFRLLGAVGAGNADPTMTAALLGCRAEEAETVLEHLADAHLLRPCGDGRYQLDHLLQAYARERTEAEDAAEDRAAALHRLLGFYLRAAREVLRSAARHGRPATAGPVPLHSPAEAWLKAERGNLRSALERASGAGLDLVGRQLHAVLAERGRGAPLPLAPGSGYAC
ncbi:BTAD domain-containing putative transcriptional regulator [Kitasatospora sp. NPDC094015]|uniref:AfsR/SARP family transcriptional regulator n=1 Tax=Kitasatospora sp. NPDC094015 TaxID=3155205 RepID=UPI0033207004